MLSPIWLAPQCLPCYIHEAGFLHLEHTPDVMPAGHPLQQEKNYRGKELALMHAHMVRLQLQ